MGGTRLRRAVWGAVWGAVEALLRTCLAHREPVRVDLENQPARNDSEMTHENPGKSDTEGSTRQDGKVPALLYLWTNPESISRSRGILSTVETAEGKGGSEPLEWGRATIPLTSITGSVTGRRRRTHLRGVLGE